MSFLKSKLNEFLIPLIFLVFTLMFEVISKIFMDFSFSDYFLINLAVILFIFTLIFVCKNIIAQIVVSSLFLIFQLVLSIMNVALQLMHGDVFSFEGIVVILDGANSVQPDFVNWGLVSLFIFFVISYFFTIFYIYLKVFKKYKKEKCDKKLLKPVVKKKFYLNAMIFLSVLIFSIGLYITGISTLNTINLSASTNQSIAVQGNDKLNYKTLIFKMDALEKFGFWGFYSKDIYNTINEQFSNKKSDMDFAKEYIKNSANGKKSDKFGVKQGNNFISILMESVDFESLHPILTPNLYALANNAQPSCVSTPLSTYSMSNYFVKGKTNVSELGAITGSATYGSKYSLSYRGQSKEEMTGAFDFSLAHKFQDLGYQTSYLISHYIDFYGRDVVFNEDVLGFDNVFDAKSIPGEEYFRYWNDFMREDDIFNYYKDKIIPADKQFYTHISTMITHGGYDDGVRGLEEYRVKVQQLIDNDYYAFPIASCGYATQEDYNMYFEYQARMMNFDDMIGDLLIDLESKGILNKTTIMLFSDHDSYYNGLSNMKNNLPVNNVTDTNRYRIPMYLVSATDSNFAPTADESIISKQVTFYDVYATICDLAGIEYNQNLCFGESVFLPEDPEKMNLLYSSTGGIFSTNIFSYNGTDLFYNKGYAPTKKELDLFYKSVNEIIYKSEIINIFMDNYLYKEL